MSWFLIDIKERSASAGNAEYLRTKLCRETTVFDSYYLLIFKSLPFFPPKELSQTWCIAYINSGPTPSGNRGSFPLSVIQTLMPFMYANENSLHCILVLFKGSRADRQIRLFSTIQCSISGAGESWNGILPSDSVQSQCPSMLLCGSVLLEVSFSDKKLKKKKKFWPTILSTDPICLWAPWLNFAEFLTLAQVILSFQ